MKPIAWVACAAVMAFAIPGCGGGGSAGVSRNTPSYSSTSSGTETTTAPVVYTGTVRFDTFGVVSMSIVPNNGGPIYTPVNPPPDAYNGEKVAFTFTTAQIPPYQRPQGEPILLLTFTPL